MTIFFTILQIIIILYAILFLSLPAHIIKQYSRIAQVIGVVGMKTLWVGILILNVYGLSLTL